MSSDRQTPHLLRYHLLGALCWLYPVGYPRICFNMNMQYQIEISYLSLDSSTVLNDMSLIYRFLLPM